MEEEREKGKGERGLKEENEKVGRKRKNHGRVSERSEYEKGRRLGEEWGG